MWNACPFTTDLIPSDTQKDHSMRNILFSAAAALLAGSTLVGSANSAELPKGAAHNIVLVHGAFVDQTSWQPVADILTKKGYNVTLVENPLTSLSADVDATKQALAKQDGRTVLVGHSWGGVVITEAGNDSKVSALVYVSAFAPDVGESLASLAKAGPPTEGGNAIRPDANGNLFIEPRVFPSAVAADLPPEIAAHLANSQLPLNHVAFEAPVDIAAWHDKPTFYVITTKDKVIAPEAQKSFATRMKAQTTQVAGSHASLVVHAKQVAEVIEKATLAK
ncbi:hydrolase [Mesorhizobium sp. LNHC209A00]|nr:hydrolase [Mesorhizobium sp. LNHC209A00]